MGDFPFHLGVNLPWMRYAEDFGRTSAGHRGVSRPENRAVLAEEFARMRNCGAKVVRWFLFADGRGGFVSEKGIPRHPGESLFNDVATALDLARQSGLRLCFSLIDYLWLQEHSHREPVHPHEQVMQFCAGREAFLHRVLIPVFREFRAHPGLFAWEIANEPEWAIREFHRAPAAKMHFADFRAFAGEVAAAVHEFADVPVTLGSARLDWVRAWTELGLDFYQAHYYPADAKIQDADLARQLAVVESLDKPLWLGELPARDAKHPRYSLEAALARCLEAGLIGAALWRWTAPEATGTDGQFGAVDPDFLTAWNSASRFRSAAV
jgi:hypothetical protein